MKTAPAWTIFLLMLLLLPAPPAVAMQSKSIAVLISREISPYIDMVEGLESALRSYTIQRFFLDSDGKPYSLTATTPDLDLEAYTVLVAVGPEALRYLQPRARDIPLLYAMILNPENVVNSAYAPPCGISLNLPVQGQFEALKNAIPGIRRLGVLFDPTNNAAWFARAHTIARNVDIELVPVQVNTHDSRTSIVGDYASLDALLFIPDKSIISKAVIRHVIKSAATKGVPVVGYNNFFYASGAALVFSIDYTKVGQQCAALVKYIVEGKNCSGNIPPHFDVRSNSIVVESLKQYRN